MQQPKVVPMIAESARADLLRLINGFQASQALHVAATLRLADHLHAGIRTATELAAATRTHPEALYRLMRTLASIGVLEEGAGRCFTLTAIGQFLRSDIGGTHAPMAELIGRPNYWQAWGGLLHAVRTGATAFDHIHGSNVWRYRTEWPEEARIFDRAMASGTERFADSVIDAYDFSLFKSVADIGGGDGAFLAKLLRAHPKMRGILYDQPHVVAKSVVARGDLERRCCAIGGNFFADVPAGADAYILKWILHDWDDRDSVAILRACRQAMKPEDKILVVEHIIGRSTKSPQSVFMDLTMLVMTGGRERTYDEFTKLFTAAGFRTLSIISTATQLSIIEGVVVD